MAAGIVTFLFTDLVGSTELQSRLGDAAADGVRRAHFGLLRDAFASHGREEVKSVSDGVMAVLGVRRARLCAPPRYSVPPFVTTMASSFE